MRRFPLCFVSLLVLTTVLGACRDSAPPEVTRTGKGVLRLGRVQAVDTVNRVVAPNERPLVLKGMRGSVHLTGARQSTADLSFIRRGRGQSPSAARSVLREITITERGTDAKYTYTLAAGQKEDYAAVDIKGQVPRGVTLRIDRLTGPVHIRGVRGPLTVTHQHGSVEIHGAAAPAEVSIKNGDVHVGFQAVPDEGEMQLRTSNGNIRLELPPGASVQIDAQTDAGVIRTRGVTLTAEQFALINAGARYEARMGAGGPTIDLRTRNGSITIGTVDTTQAPPSDTGSASVPASTPIPASDTTVVPQSDSDTTKVDTATVDTTTTDTTRF